MGTARLDQPVAHEDHVVAVVEQQRADAGSRRWCVPPPWSRGVSLAQPARDERLGVRVDRTGGVDGRQHLGIGQQRAGQRQALPLTARTPDRPRPRSSRSPAAAPPARRRPPPRAAPRGRRRRQRPGATAPGSVRIAPGSISADSARRLNDPSSAPPTSATKPTAVNVIGRIRPHSATRSRSSARRRPGIRRSPRWR